MPEIVLPFTDFLDDDKLAFEEANKTDDNKIWVACGPVAVRMSIGEVLAWKTNIFCSTKEHRGGAFVTEQLCQKLSDAVTELKRVDEALADDWIKQGGSK